MRVRFWSVMIWLAWGAAVFCLFPSAAGAWGPGAHLECSEFLLQNLVLLAPAMARLLRRHPFAFTYGAVCPDMVLGKRFMKPEESNHNWTVSLRLLENAETARERSFALGYLSHLAADTVAHNLYIPDQILRHYDRRRRNHMMQELIFDAMLGEKVWRMAREVACRPFPECEVLLHRTLPRTPLPKKVNLRIFRSGVLLVRLGGWQKIIRRLHRQWDDELPRPLMAPYLEAMHQAVVSFLNDPLSSPCRQVSPAGAEILPAAYLLRRTLRRLEREDSLDHGRLSSLLTAFYEWRARTLPLPPMGIPAPVPA